MRIKVLDGFRGYATILVVLAHSPQITDSLVGRVLKAAFPVFKIGYVCLDIFFILSGFLITRMLIQEKKENRFSFKNFYIKRALRIFPMYYIILILCGILFTWEGVEYTATYLSNYYFAFNTAVHPLKHTWSLAVEEHYYFFWPLIIYFCSLDKIKKYLIPITYLIVLVSLVGVYSYFDTMLASGLTFRGTNFRILTIAMGSLLAFYEQPLLLKLRNKRLINKLFLSFVLLYGIFIFFRVSMPFDIVSRSILPLLLLSLVAFVLFLIVLSFEHSKSAMNFIFTNGAVTYVGRISYSIYLFHMPVFYFFGITNQQLKGKWIEISDYLLPISLIFLLPVLTYYLIEKPLLNYKNKLIK